jgi:hypothetical protein
MGHSELNVGVSTTQTQPEASNFKGWKNKSVSDARMTTTMKKG